MNGFGPSSWGWTRALARERVSSKLPRRRFYRWVFLLAGAYNLAWGLWSSLDPQWFFRFTGLPPLNHPSIFACLAMLVGLYGFVYFEIARVPERGWPLAAVGLIGKILGPVGLAVLIVRGDWPPSSIVLCLGNDLLWWMPFGMYLKDSWPAYRADLSHPPAA